MHIDSIVRMRYEDVRIGDSVNAISRSSLFSRDGEDKLIFVRDSNLYDIGPARKDLRTNSKSYNDLGIQCERIDL